MKIRIDLSVGGENVKEAFLQIEDRKVDHLTEEELLQAVEINIRSWADREIGISWEIVEFPARPEDEKEG
ncbi:hypothetical protein P4H65_07610 [Paenibacillus chitinolyticus]|uniref:hypothetical protein n=1 Tax=Paenibacillus chitinolyticus TaxID=79263 RepID=UPI002DB66AAC|nr:hypothetical protein [Paenibacillus chitinolyticus]MEC0245659.1 hypothetical protein [Paenibacillus chitinolyticus]